MKLKSIFLGVLALIGAGKVVSLASAGVAVALVRLGGWDMAEAAHVAPWLLFAVVGALSISLWCLHDINEDHKQSSPYGKVDCTAYRQDERKGA